MYLNGTVLTVSGNYMKVYELDPVDWDEHVDTLYYPDCSVALECNGVENCTGSSSWKNENGHKFGCINAMIRLKIAYTKLIE